MEQKSIIYNHTISHDESVSHGMYYLTREINAEEAKVFFNEAFRHGHAVFEDHMGYKYKLIYSGGEYKLTKAAF